MTKLPVEYYAVLRKPLESGRQSPKKLAEAFLLSVPIVWLLYLVTFTVAADSTNYPNVEKIRTTQFIMTVVVSILGIIFSFPSIYRKTGWLQYAYSVLLAQFTFLICYVSVFVLPEQIVITYCKIRFKAFNYNSRGYLHNIEKIELKRKNV